MALNQSYKMHTSFKWPFQTASYKFIKSEYNTNYIQKDNDNVTINIVSNHSANLPYLVALGKAHTHLDVKIHIISQGFIKLEDKLHSLEHLL